jgi:hypothetical protein
LYVGQGEGELRILLVDEIGDSKGELGDVESNLVTSEANKVIQKVQFLIQEANWGIPWVRRVVHKVD